MLIRYLKQCSKGVVIQWKRNGRLLFLAFIKPIINGIGFDFKEVQISENKEWKQEIIKAKDKEIYAIWV